MTRANAIAAEICGGDEIYRNALIRFLSPTFRRVIIIL
jgi:hypothetical protein